MDKFLEDSFGNGNVQLFVGSGLSDVFYPNGEQLCQKLLKALIYVEGSQTRLLDVLKGRNVSLEDAAQFYEVYQGTGALVRFLKDEFGEAKRPIDVHENLWKLPHVQWIYTTNFDCLIEDALGRPKQLPEVLTRASDIRELSPDRRAVFKPHGCARRSVDRSEFVITRNDYLNYSQRRPLESLKTLYDISTNVFLFLGYSLNDLNMRYIISEASRIGNVQSYAVVLDSPGPEARYWEQIGVRLIMQEASEFIDEVLKVFPANEFEWDQKSDTRVADKEEIANKAVKEIQKALEDEKGRLNLILDSGSTPAFLARALCRESIQKNIDLSQVRILTNSPVVMKELVPVMQKYRDLAGPTIIGGPLRFDTRAFTPDQNSARYQLKVIKKTGFKTLAFLGATAVDREGLKTKTETEVPVKREFVRAADEVFLLADHSKSRLLTSGHVFAEWDKKEFVVITDRVGEMAEISGVAEKIL